MLEVKPGFAGTAAGWIESWRSGKPIKPVHGALRRIGHWAGRKLNQGQSLFSESIGRGTRRTPRNATEGPAIHDDNHDDRHWPPTAGGMLNSQEVGESDVDYRPDQLEKPGAASSTGHQLDEKVVEDIFRRRESRLDTAISPESEDQTSTPVPADEDVDEEITRPAPGKEGPSEPLFKTMIETLPSVPSGSGEPIADYLSESLGDIFRKKTHANPRVKRLLQRHDVVDVRELAQELSHFASSIGARRNKG